MSVTIKSFSNGLSGKLISGDIVSVIAPDYRKMGATVIPPELKYVEVIGVTASSGYDTDTGQGLKKEDEKQLPATVTLLVSPEQSTILAGLEADGKLHLSLVYRGSKENAAKFIEAQDKALKALYPAPAGDATKENTGAAPPTDKSSPESEGE
jgi:pilus assembly protein CpaB